jgi:hypothetical protein
MCPKYDSQVWSVGNFEENERAALALTCGFHVFVPLSHIMCILSLFLSLTFFGQYFLSRFPFFLSLLLSLLFAVAFILSVISLFFSL